MPEATPEPTMADVPPSICEVLLDVLVKFGLHVPPPRGIKPPPLVVALYEAQAAYYAPVNAVFERELMAAGTVLDGIAAIVDEPLDERAGHGPTRHDQFRKIENAIRHWRGSHA
jgi:hypothetical protein